MAWRAARSLIVLRDQINAAYPQRNKASDGTIGDAAHAASVSDHNPDGSGVVRALDITHDPAHGCDIDKLTDQLAASRDPRISYLIANRLITGPDYGWSWATYYGDDPHTNHFHLSVVSDSRADDTSPWNINGGSIMSRTDDIISHWNNGVPRLPDGTIVCPVEWRISDEKFQASTQAKLDGLTKKVDAMTAMPELDYVKLVSEMIKQFSAE